MNKSILIGRVTKDFEPKYSQNGNMVLKFGLAVDRDFKGADGKKEVDFINCLAFGKTGEYLVNYTGKGKLIAVDGRIQTGSYVNKDNAKIYTTEVVADKVQVLEWGDKTDKPTTDADGFVEVSEDGFPF